MSDSQPPTPATDEPTPKAKQLTIGQHLFIWSMIIIVGVLFGMGSSVSLLQHGPRTIQGVGENDILIRQDIARRLQECLNPGRRPVRGAPFSLMFEHGNQSWYAADILRARHAAALGLLPEGGDLDRIAAEFLAQPMPGQPGRTLRDVLVEHQGSRDEVTAVALRRFLGERKAVDALVARHVLAPAVPAAYAADLGLFTETVEADVVELGVKPLLAPVDEADPEVQAAYERLRPTRFARPASATVVVAYPDLDAIGAAIVPVDAEIQAWYDAHQDAYRKPADPKAGVAADAVRPLDEVKAEVVAAIRRDRAQPKAQEAVHRFTERVDRLDHPDAAVFAREAEAAGLAVSQPIVVPEGRGGQLALGALGSVKDHIGLFSSAVEPGFISSPLAMPAGSQASWIVLRLDSRQAAGFRPLDEVKPEVMAYVAGQRAYKQLIERAEAARAAAEQAGPGGLAAWAASPAAAPWSAAPAVRTWGPLAELQPPAAEPGGAPGEARPVASLCLPARPVMLAAAEGAGDLPSVRLVQVKAVKAGEAPKEGDRDAMFAGQYRNALISYRAQLFDEELRRAVGK